MSFADFAKSSTRMPPKKPMNNGFNRLSTARFPRPPKTPPGPNPATADPPGADPLGSAGGQSTRTAARRAASPSSAQAQGSHQNKMSWALPKTGSWFALPPPAAKMNRTQKAKNNFTHANIRKTDLAVFLPPLLASEQNQNATKQLNRCKQR